MKHIKTINEYSSYDNQPFKTFIVLDYWSNYNHFYQLLKIVWDRVGDNVDSFFCKIIYSYRNGKDYKYITTVKDKEEISNNLKYQTNSYKDAINYFNNTYKIS